ncbi:MAG: HWE histidine kinase domain-containing protein [Xanthobacteraceae bacterium]
MPEITCEDFLLGGGEMGALTRAYDWTKTPLGAPASWPQSLKTAVRLLLTSQHPMFIWWGPELIQFYNDAYRQTMGPERHPSALGQRGRDCWQEIWEIIGPQIELVMSGKGATWHDDQLVPVTRHGRREDVWWTYGYSPIDEGGEVGGVLVVCNDVTAQHLLTEQLKQANLRLADESNRLRQLFNEAPGFMCVLRGPQHVAELANAAYLRLVGSRSLLGKPVREAFPEIEGQGFFELLDQVYATGTPFVGRRLPIAFQGDSSEPLAQHFLDFVYQPITDERGDVSGIFVEGSDVTDHVLAEQQQQLLIRELQHRVQNTLATVQAILAATARSSHSISDFQEAFSGRLVALGKTHSVLSENERQIVTLLELLRFELEPYDDRTGRRVVLEGPSVGLPAIIAIPLGLAFHELATNAAKYGALSDIAGVVTVKWRTESEDGRDMLHIQWVENNGPEVVEPKREGFGTRLLRRALPAQAGAQVTLNFAPTGLRVDLSMPLIKGSA